MRFRHWSVAIAIAVGLAGCVIESEWPDDVLEDRQGAGAPPIGPGACSIGDCGPAGCPAGDVCCPFILQTDQWCCFDLQGGECPDPVDLDPPEEEPDPCPECAFEAIPTLDCFPLGYVDPDPSDPLLPGEGVCGDEATALAEAKAELDRCHCEIDALDDNPMCTGGQPECELDTAASLCCDEGHAVLIAACELGNCMNSEDCRGPGNGIAPADCSECKDDGTEGPLKNHCPCNTETCAPGMQTPGGGSGGGGAPPNP